MRSRISRRPVLALRVLPVVALVLGGLAACGSDQPAEDKATAGACEYVDGGEAAKDVEKPPTEPKSYDTLTIATNRGDMKATLDAKATPCAVNSFGSLAEQGFYDDTKCHRLVPGFVLQCGDPTATGTGGPGYSFADELTGSETYPPGTLAMANSGTPDTNGSQFFIVLAESGLPPQYVVMGSVDAAGLKVAQAIEKDGNAADGVNPAKPVVIASVS